MDEHRAVTAARRGGRPKRPKDRIGDLTEAGLLPDVDFCVDALDLGERGLLVLPEHLTTCSVCLRRWRVTEAELQGWAPMTHDGAARVMVDMAEAFGSSERSAAYRPFYAHVARCAECERWLAELTFDRTPPRATRPPVV